MQLSDGEWKVMRALWRLERGTVREICRDLEPETGWAYSTVKTQLDRLAEKGAVRVDRSAGARRFLPTIAPTEARRSALRSLVDRAFGGTTGNLVRHLVQSETLSEKDRQELGELLAAEGALQAAQDTAHASRAPEPPDSEADTESGDPEPDPPTDDPENP